MTNKNLLIVTYNFPPVNVISSHRFNELSYYLNENGITPWILTTNSVGTLESLVPESNIIRIGNNHKRNQKSQEFHGFVKHARNLIMKLKLRSKILDYSIPWYFKVKKSQELIKAKLPKIDFIIGTYGPAAPLFIANFLAKQMNCPWIADYRDFCSMGSTNYTNSLLNKIDKLIEYKLVKSSSCLFTVSKTMAKILEDSFFKESYVIYNGWNYRDINSLNIITPHVEHDHYIYYGGTIHQHQINSVETLIRSIVAKKYLIVKFRSLGPSSSDKVILELARKHNVQDRVIIMPPVDHQTSINEANQAVCNLVLEDLSCTKEYQRGVLTGKFLKLLPLNPPILSIAHRDSEMGDILRRTEKGCLCSTEEEIVEFFNLLHHEPVRYKGIENEIIKFSSKDQAKMLSNIIKNFN
jgi:hypothetical protein